MRDLGQMLAHVHDARGSSYRNPTGVTSSFRRIVPNILAAVFPSPRVDQSPNMNERADPSREAPIAKCDVCGGEMKCLGKLPEIRTKKAVQVFRCYGCNNVTSEPAVSPLR